MATTDISANHAVVAHNRPWRQVGSSPLTTTVETGISLDVELVAWPMQVTCGQDKRDTLTRYCLDCDVRFACNSGCPKDRFAMSPYGEPGQHYLRPGYKLFFHHVGRRMRIMTDLLRAGDAPAGLVQLYATEDVRRGRNEPCTCGSGRKWKHCHAETRVARHDPGRRALAAGECHEL